MTDQAMLRPRRQDIQSRVVHFILVAILLSLVSDGWSGKPSPLLHQLILVPCTLALAYLLRILLKGRFAAQSSPDIEGKLPQILIATLLVFEGWSIALIGIEARHYARFGYHLTAGALVVFALTSAVAGAILWQISRSQGTITRHQAVLALLAVFALYAAGLGVAIADFPLNYLRSDMLPVISWADLRLWHHRNPYGTMHVGSRSYDFPYLPGMLLAFLPVIALGLDLRFANLLYLGATAVLVFWAAEPSMRLFVTGLLGGFLLCPFLQYRHDLYLQPHWLALTAAVVLMQRRRLAWSAFTWGVSCGIYQLSWVIVPFFVLHVFRRGGFREAVQAVLLTLAGFLTVAGPFLPFAMHQVANNTVAQWSHLQHALADPINLSYWVTFFLRPDQLRWVQATVLTALFASAALRRGCKTIADTLRYMVIGLAIFIALNVLVDGYFYLTLLLLLLLYLCASLGLWSAPVPSRQGDNLSYDAGPTTVS